MYMSISTPWGPSQTVTQLSDAGVSVVTTASHGGIYVPRELQGFIPRACKPFTGLRAWWEEDSDWAYPFICLPDHFRAWGPVRRLGMATCLQHAINSVRMFYPDRMKVLARQIASHPGQQEVPKT